MLHDETWSGCKWRAVGPRLAERAAVNAPDGEWTLD
jgi:hypothetical protein